MRPIIIYLLILFSLLAVNSYGQSYNFPVRPGDEAWKVFDNSNDMYSACQIPNEILESMSTKDLVETCLNYPLIGTLYAYNDLQAGFDALRKKFNGIEELIGRKDSGKELIKVYSNMSPEKYGDDWSDEKKGDFTFEFSYIETFLAQREVLATLSLTEKKELVRLCSEKYTAKQNNITIFGTLGTSNTAWVIARTMDSQNSANEKGAESDLAKNTFIEQGLVIDFAVVENILEKAQSFIK